MKIICPYCHTQISATNINITAMTAVCQACSEVFPFSAASEAATKPNETERPRIVTVDDSINGGMRLSWRWWRWSYVFLVFFAIAWDGFLIFWYTAAIFGIGGKGGTFSLIAIFFPICHVAVGVGLTYFLIASFFNRTVIEVDQEFVRVRHGPIPWIGNLDLQRERIHRLKINAVEKRNKGQVSTSFGLLAELDPDGQVTMIRNFHDHEHAHYVARCLAATLKVKLREN